MRVLQINIFGNLSTGRIATDLYRVLKSHGEDGIVAFSRNTIEEGVPYIKIGSYLDVVLHGICARITDRVGLYSSNATRKLITKIISYSPDVIHLHNLHGYYINYKILFEFLNNYNRPVVWTFHDCWPFTGHCCYYSMAECNKWESLCYNCSQKHSYPASLFKDSSTENFKLKRELFTKNKNLSIVAVSDWLNNEIQKSFFSKFDVSTIYNGIDLNLFYPHKSAIRDKYGIGNRFMILSVASTWDKRKGLDDLINLSSILNDDYVIVAVGLSDRQISGLPPKIIGINRTYDAKELSDLYSTADIYFNASVEETFGLTTIEAMACGTTAIVYNATANPELISPLSGYIVDPHDVENVKNIITNFPKNYTNEYAIKKASCYNKDDQYLKYLNLYKSILRRSFKG